MAKCPVNKVRLPDDSTAWLVTGVDEAREVMIDQRYSRALVFAPGRTHDMAGDASGFGPRFFAMNGHFVG